MHTHLIIIAWLAPVINALQTPPRKKVVVVGAGWAGLSTAWTLSKNNVDVTLVDAAARPGGVVRDGFTTRGGRPAEAGQHGFWEEYFNIYKLLYDELKLEEVIARAAEAPAAADAVRSCVGRVVRGRFLE